MSELSAEMQAYLERKTYDAAIIGPQPDDGAAFVLIAYDKAGPFGPGATHYSVDRLVIDGQSRDRYAYRGDKLIVQFPKDIMYVMISRDIVALLDQEERKKSTAAAPTVHSAGDAKSEDEPTDHKGYL